MLFGKRMRERLPFGVANRRFAVLPGRLRHPFLSLPIMSKVRPDCCSLSFHLLFYLPFNTGYRRRQSPMATATATAIATARTTAATAMRNGDREARPPPFLSSFRFLFLMCLILTDMVHTAHEHARVKATPRHRLQCPAARFNTLQPTLTPDLSTPTAR
jgi:hypothetical protein